MPDEDYYALCVELCQTNGWWATYWAIQEDGYSPSVDWKKLYDEWKEDSK